MDTQLSIENFDRESYKTMKIDGVEVVSGDQILIKYDGHWSKRTWRPSTWRRRWIPNSAQNGIYVVSVWRPEP